VKFFNNLPKNWAKLANFTNISEHAGLIFIKLSEFVDKLMLVTKLTVIL